MPNEDEDEETCAICYEKFTLTSDHRIAALKCGHVFGYSCIGKWLKRKESRKRCPKCNQVSDQSDVRIIYAKSIVAKADQNAIEKLEDELDKIKNKCSAFQQQVDSLNFNLAIKESQLSYLKSEFGLVAPALLAQADLPCSPTQTASAIVPPPIVPPNFFSSPQTSRSLISSPQTSISTAQSNAPVNPSIALRSASQSPLPARTSSFVPAGHRRESNLLSHLHTINLETRSNGIFVISTSLQYFVIAQHTRPYDFGVQIYHLNNSRTHDEGSIILHRRPIVCMALHFDGKSLLTGSSDGNVKISDLQLKQVLATFHFGEGVPCSVIWSKSNDKMFYVGLSNGTLCECCKMTNSILRNIIIVSTPIKSIFWLNQAHNRINLLVASNKTSYFCEIYFNSAPQSDRSNVCLHKKSIPMNGPIVSSDVVSDSTGYSGHILMTVGPGNNFQKNVQHYVYHFELTADNIQCNLLKRYLGGHQFNIANKLRSRLLLLNPFEFNSYLIVSGDEYTQGALAWKRNESDSRPIQKFTFNSLVNDVELYRSNQSSNPILAMLTQQSLHLYELK